MPGVSILQPGDFRKRRCSWCFSLNPEYPEAESTATPFLRPQTSTRLNDQHIGRILFALPILVPSPLPWHVFGFGGEDVGRYLLLNCLAVMLSSGLAGLPSRRPAEPNHTNIASKSKTLVLDTPYLHARETWTESSL